jgi:hypothetical protein
VHHGAAAQRRYMPWPEPAPGGPPAPSRIRSPASAVACHPGSVAGRSGRTTSGVTEPDLRQKSLYKKGCRRGTCIVTPRVRTVSSSVPICGFRRLDLQLSVGGRQARLPHPPSRSPPADRYSLPDRSLIVPVVPPWAT